MAQEVNTSIAGQVDIKWMKGDDFEMVFTFKVNRVLENLSSQTFTAKIFALDDANKTALVSFAVGSGLTNGGSAGTITLTKTPAQMTGLTSNTVYAWEMSKTTAAGKVYKVLFGQFEVLDTYNV